MTIRVRNGGVYDWETPLTPSLTKRELRTSVPVHRQDSESQIKIKVMSGVLSAEHKQDKRGRRRVFHSNGLEVGVIVHRDRWYLHGHLFADGQKRTGKVDKKSVAMCMTAMAKAL